MFTPSPLTRSGVRQRLWVAVATVAGVLATAAPVQATQSAYVTDGFNVHQFEIVAGGLLVSMNPARVPTGGQSPTAMAVSPDFKSLYAANEDSGSISQYDIGRDGALSLKSPATVPAGFSPRGVAVRPDGHSVYVSGHDYVRQYDVGPGGELSPKSPPTVASGDIAQGVAVSPDGQSVYVTSYTYTSHTSTNVLRQYDVGPGGKLSPKSPATVAYPGDNSYSVAVSPDGQSVYAPTNVRAVAQFDVGPGGALSLKSPAQVDADLETTGVAVSPDGQSVYVTNHYAASVSQYDVGPGGRLAPMTPATVPAHEGPYGIAVSPDGESVYVPNRGTDTDACLGNPGACGNVSQFDVGPGGELSPKSPAKVATGTGGGAVGVAVTPGLVPTAKQQCKHGGWKRWGFRRQRRCVPFVKRQARQSCHAARKVVGRRAFRREYGNKQHRRAMRRCIKEEIGTR
jgi:DNA-binding beta-propeller fold protein YncE